MAIFKVEAEGDVMYIERPSEKLALQRLTEACGSIPRNMLTITEVDSIPPGEEAL